MPQDYDPKQFRIRCFGHIINLSIQAFLRVPNRDNLDSSLTLYDVDYWLKFGPLGKLCIVANKIAVSPQIAEKFEALSGGHRLPKPNDTRWFGWDRLIQRALKLQPAIDRFWITWGEEKERDLWLTAEDWEIIKSVSFTMLCFTLTL